MAGCIRRLLLVSFVALGVFRQLLLHIHVREWIDLTSDFIDLVIMARDQSLARRGLKGVRRSGLNRFLLNLLL